MTLESNVTRREFMRGGMVAASSGAFVGGPMFFHYAPLFAATDFDVQVRDAGACGPPPPPKPAQRSASEGVPPLPIPVTPQRRTEKKKPPTPPTLVIKIVDGAVSNWATDRNDINNLLTWMKTAMKVNFSYEEKPLNQVAFDVEMPPLLYRTGHDAFEMTAGDRQILRDYILKGGFIYFDACCGRQGFVDSVRRELAVIFPERRLEPLPADHPIYRCYYDVPEVAYTPYANISGMAPPPFEGIDIGCRTAVLFSPFDLSCGWDMHTHDTCAGVQAKYALQLGANMMAYATATKTMGKSLATSRVYVDKNPSRADKFRIGQVIHDGQWNPNVARLSTLVDTVGRTTSLRTSFADEPVKLDSRELTEFPFLYMTGHRKFTLSKDEAIGLQRYLQFGGFLLAEACCGRQSFDLAFRAHMQKLFPGQRLTPIKLDHPIYSMHHKVQRVNFTKAALSWNRKLRNPSPPALMGLEIDGHLAVVYSPYGLGNGWELSPNPYAIAYESKDAIELGVNTVLYTMMH